jgi:hypothetical protein
MPAQAGIQSLACHPGAGRHLSLTHRPGSPVRLDPGLRRGDDGYGVWPSRS